MGTAVELSLLSCIEAEIYVISFLLAVNDHYFRHNQLLDSIFICICVLPDPENMSIAVEISLLSRIGAETHVFSILLPVIGHHL